MATSLTIRRGTCLVSELSLGSPLTGSTESYLLLGPDLWSLLGLMQENVPRITGCGVLEYGAHQFSSILPVWRAGGTACH